MTVVLTAIPTAGKQSLGAYCMLHAMLSTLNSQTLILRACGFNYHAVSLINKGL